MVNAGSGLKPNSFRPIPELRSLDPGIIFTDQRRWTTQWQQPPREREIACQPGLSMRKIKEVLRLRFELGLGLRAIARSCSIGLGLLTSTYGEPKRPASVRRWGRIGTKTG